MSSCHDQTELCSTHYYGYWDETPWEFEIIDNQKFKFKYNGHYNVGETTGQYHVINDTFYVDSINNNSIFEHGVLNEKYIIDEVNCCLIDPGLKYDYCFNSERSSEFRAIEYPQKQSNSKDDQRFIDSIFLIIVQELLGEADPMMKFDTLFVQPYYELGITFDDETVVSNRLIVANRKDSSLYRWNNVHIRVDKINWNRKKKLFIGAHLYPSPWDNSVLSYFLYENGVYTRDVR
jgi:hypothetical protein